MQLAARIIAWFVRIAGLIQIALGLLFWMGHARQFLMVHIVNGFLIVAALWTLAILSLISGAHVIVVILALAWGVALPALGLPQMAILVGEWHWVIRVVHLLMGLVALGLADRLAGTITGRSR